MKEVDHKQGGFDIRDSESEVARARLAFDPGLREATEAGGRAARRLVVPALWGIALAGGAFALFAVARLAKRRSREHALVRVVVEPLRSQRSLVRAAGAAALRLIAERLLSSMSTSMSGASRESYSMESVSGESPRALVAEPVTRLDSSSVQGNSASNGRRETFG